MYRKPKEIQHDTKFFELWKKVEKEFQQLFPNPLTKTHGVKYFIKDIRGKGESKIVPFREHVKKIEKGGEPDGDIIIHIEGLVDAFEFFVDLFGREKPRYATHDTRVILLEDDFMVKNRNKGDLTEAVREHTNIIRNHYFKILGIPRTQEGLFPEAFWKALPFYIYKDGETFNEMMMGGPYGRLISQVIFVKSEIFQPWSDHNIAVEKRFNRTAYHFMDKIYVGRSTMFLPEEIDLEVDRWLWDRRVHSFACFDQDEEPKDALVSPVNLSITREISINFSSANEISLPFYKNFPEVIVPFHMDGFFEPFLYKKMFSHFVEACERVEEEIEEEEERASVYERIGRYMVVYISSMKKKYKPQSFDEILSAEKAFKEAVKKAGLDEEESWLLPVWSCFKTHGVRSELFEIITDPDPSTGVHFEFPIPIHWDIL